MKKIILSAAALFVFGFANAQDVTVTTTTSTTTTDGFGFAKGDIFLEGQISFSSGTDSESFEGSTFFEEKSSSFVLAPRVGFFVADRFAVGIQLAYVSAKNETYEDDGIDGNDDTVEQTGNGFQAGVFARYYFLELGQRFKTYTELGVDFGSQTFETNSVETQKDKGINVGIDLGINYFVTPKMAISFGLSNVLSYNSVTSEFPGGGEAESNEFNGNLNVFNNFFDTPTFGLLYKF